MIRLILDRIEQLARIFLLSAAIWAITSAIPVLLAPDMPLDAEPAVCVQPV